MIWAFIIGLILGAIFFGGLWFTVNKIVNARMPALWVMGSFILRIGITLFGFAYIGLRDWRKLLICMAGFIIARFLVIYFTRPKTQDSPDLKETGGINKSGK
jgi:F1F0 ATPase subunit 2